MPPTERPPPPPRFIHSTMLFSKLDMYRKVPTDLMEGTKRGSVLSVTAVVIMITLFLLETFAFWEKHVVHDLSLDRSDDSRLRINFNITMMDLNCEWAVIDVVVNSALGNTDQNVTAHIKKWQLDSNGIKKIYRSNSRHVHQRDHQIDLYDGTVSQSLEELHVNGQDAVELTPESLEYAKRENDYVFVDFYAPWCNHCRDLEPTWEALAELMVDAGERLDAGQRRQNVYSDADLEEAQKVEVPVMIAKVNCVEHSQLCKDNNIRAYPTLRLYVDGEKSIYGDYKGHRTILEMVEWLFHVEEDHKSHMSEHERELHAAHLAARQRLHGEEDYLESDEEKQWHDKIIRDKKRLHHKWVEEEHPGCQLSGHLLVDRTPGNFHIQARSSNQEFAAHMTNVSHIVHSLTIGDPMVQHFLNKKRDMNMKGTETAMVPPNVLSKVNPMDGNMYINYDLHESYHHYLKLVSTHVEGFQAGRRQLRMFQIVENSQLSFYDANNEQEIPEAKFSYDLSPIAVGYRIYKRQWYEYITSIMAIVGGVFTVVGMIEASIRVTASKVQNSWEERRMRSERQQQQQRNRL